MVLTEKYSRKNQAPIFLSAIGFLKVIGAGRHQLESKVAMNGTLRRQKAPATKSKASKSHYDPITSYSVEHLRDVRRHPDSC
jgi:hypothetical protein